MSRQMVRASRAGGNSGLRDFLRLHIDRLCPENLGLEGHSGRRGRPVSGLSYRDLGELMHMDPRTVGRIVRGEIDPTDDELELFATVLQLLPRERTHLFQMATGRDPGPSSVEVAGAGLSSFWQGLLPTIEARESEENGHTVWGPLVYANTLGWDLLVYNDAFAEMFEGGRPPQNTFHWIAKDGRDQLPEHDRLWLGLLLPQLHGVLHKYPDHPGLLALKNWCETTPGVAEAWADSFMSSYQTPDGDIRPLIHAKRGLGAIEMGVLAPHRVGQGDLRVFMMNLHQGVTPEEVRNKRLEAAARQGAEGSGAQPKNSEASVPVG